MNPQNYNQIPQGQAAPQPYGAGAAGRAAAAAQPVNRPLQVPGHAAPTAQPTAKPSAPVFAPQSGQPMQPGQPIAQPGFTNPATQPVPYNPTQPDMQPAAGPAARSGQPLIQPLPGQSQYNPNQAVIPDAPKVVENPISTQATLQFSELRDSLVIMKDGSFRAVVACQSINFDLMSETEREGVEYSYQNFLNSLNFTTQILVRSQKVDIGPYIERLIKMRRDNDNMLLGVLMDDYINFIDVLAQEANIMDKSFFIIIPYYASADLERAVEQTKNFFKAMGKNKSQNVTRISRDTYNKAIDELNNRVETIISGLYQIGIQSVRLNTKELSELFYNFNNPDTAVREPLVDFTKLATMYVKKGKKE